MNEHSEIFVRVFARHHPKPVVPRKTPAQVAEEACTELLKIDLFALGPTGSSGIPSKGESLFQKILLAPRALEHFKDLLRHGTDAAKLYALLGLRHCDAKAFEQHRASVELTQASVNSQGGCCEYYLRAADLIEAIAKGQFDSYVNPAGSWRRQFT